VFFGLVRTKVNAARPKIVSTVIATLISGLLVSIPIPANASAGANGVVIIRYATPVTNGVPTWGNITSNTPNRAPDGYGCQWQFLPAVAENGSALTNYLVTISTSADYSSLPYKPTAGTIVKTDMPITPAQTSTTLLQLDRNFFSSFGAVAGTRYYFFFKPVNASGAATESKSIGNCDISSFVAPGPPGTPTVVAGDASATVTITAPTIGNSPSSYTVSAFDNSGNALNPAKTCTVTVPNTSCEITGLTNGTPYKFKSTATNSAGTSTASAFSSAATPTGPVAPTVTGVSSSTTNGSYNVGDSISIQVTFSEAVTVTGTPQLTLETGSTDQVLNYASGSGTSTLTFSYTIQAGDTSSDLTYIATNPLALNGGTIKNASSLDAVLTLPSPTDTGSLGANKAIVVDTTLPTVTSFSSTTPDGSYKAGSQIDITATLSEVVTTAASITVTLDNGQTVVLTHNTENNTLTGSYTIGSGQSSSDLGISSFALTSAPVDLAGNIMTSTTLPAGNISGTRTIVVDTSAPTVSSFSSTTSDGAYKVGATINITATLSEAVTAAASITVTLDNGKTVVLTHNAVNNTLTGTYTVAAGDTSADLNVSSYALTSAPADAAGNIMSDLTVPSGSNNIAGSKTIVVDTTAPSTPSTPDLATASDSAGASDTDNITSDNTPTINVSGSFSGTAVVTATKAGSTSVTCTISSNACTLGTLADGVWSLTVTDTDAAGNATTSTALSLTIDGTVPTPTVATVSVTTSSGVTVRSSEAGTAYLVKSTVTVSNLSSITGAADDSMNQVTISAANSDTAMSTSGLVAGEYKLYVVDAAGNLSSASSNTVTVAVAAAPTSNSTAAPTGTTTFGSTLTNAVTFNGVPSPTLSYQWKSCTNATDTATVCSDISGASSSSFIANVIDLVGKFIRVFVTAINSESPNATAWSSPTAAITAVAPGVPTLGTPTLGDLQINVPVTAPASNGGSTITKYQFSTDGGATWMDRTDTATVSSPIVIKFLSTNGTTPIVAGTTYPVQIRAVNSASSPNGLGTASVSIVAATAPGAPNAVSATATGQTTATVSFTAPASNGGSAITSYTVTSSPGGITATGSTSPITVSGLTASTAYTFTVTASNAAATSVASTASTSVTTSAPPAPAPAGPAAPAPEPEPVCEAACIAAQAAAAQAAAAKAAVAQAAAAKAAADKVIADRVAAEAKVVAEKIASDTAAKVVADKVVVDKSAAEAAAKTAIDKATAAAVAKATADAAAVQAAAIAKAAADAQAAAVVAAANAAAALRSATTSAASRAAATAKANRAATTASNTVQAAAAAAKVAATARATASNASKQVDIALGALNSKTAAATTAAQANAIAAAAKAAANEAAKVAADQARAAKVASNNANREASAVAARIATEQKEAADAATQAKIATDAVLRATEEMIAAATDAQRSAEAVVKALEEKIALAEASVKAKDITERAAIDKVIEEVTVKVAEAQKVADAANARAEATVTAQERAQTAATAAAQEAQVQAAEAVAVKDESTTKTAVASKAAADASLAAKVATAAKAAAAKVPAKAVIAAKPGNSSKKNSATATISGLKPGQKVKVTVNVKGK
jgi:hypothetical protein